MAIPLARIVHIPLFQGISENVLSTIAGSMVSRNYAQNAVIFRKGDATEYMAFVLRGTLQVVDLSEDGRAVGISTLKVGSYFGEMSIIDGKPRSTSIVAMEPSEVAFLPKITARQLILHYPNVAERVMTRLAEIIRNSANQRALLSIPNAFQRVFVQIQNLAENARDGSTIESLPKQHEMANMVNTSRETVSRAIHLLQKTGIISKQGRVIIIQKPKELRQVAENGIETLEAPESKKQLTSSKP